MDIPIHGIYHQKPFCQLQYSLNGIGKSFLYPRLYDQTVYNDLYIMFDILIQTDLLRKLIHISINLHTDVTASLGLLQKLGMGSLTSSHNRSQQLELRSLRKRHNTVYHLVYCLLLNLSSAFGTMGDSHSGIQKSEIVINLRHSPHCGTGITVGRFLINGNGRGQTLDALHIRLLHLSQELPCIRRKGFHITSLSLCINGIKSQ